LASSEKWISGRTAVVTMNEKITKKAIELMKTQYICDNCLGRQFAELLSGLSNDERGKIIRHYIAFLLDAGEKIDIDTSNFYGMKFRNVKIKPKKPGKCKVCKNFFLEKIDTLAKSIVKKLSGYEFDTFLIGTVVSTDLIKAEEGVWEKAGIEFVEPIKSEINREIGKRIERVTKKNFSIDTPDITAIINLSSNKVELQIRSLYIYGKYQKLARGISQTKWICRECGGKGCVVCKGEGKLYKTSVQEIVEKQLITVAKAKRSKFHAAGREDVDARCLGKRPFVIELVKPRKRKFGLKKIQSQINKSKKIKVYGLKIASKKGIQEVKFSRYDKTYLAEVTFAKKTDKKKLKLLKNLEGTTINQKTPKRVVHRRSERIRKRKVKKVSVKAVGGKKLELKIRGEAGLYIKELITGDDGRTEPNISTLLNNKVKSIKLDVIKIHSS
jgi:tRNA pseudouridine synthase 10